MNRRSSCFRSQGAQAQQGAVAIEFAFLFAIFFVVLYATVSYGMVMLVQQALTQAAAEGARAAIGRVNPLVFKSVAEQRAQQAVLARAAATTALSWLPQATKNRIIDAGIGVVWVTNNVTIQTGEGATALPMTSVTVTITYPDYAASPMLPILRMPGFGPVPTVPQNLVGKASAT